LSKKNISKKIIKKCEKSESQVLFLVRGRMAARAQGLSNETRRKLFTGGDVFIFPTQFHFSVTIKNHIHHFFNNLKMAPEI
jgi:hypothetical protein